MNKKREPLFHIAKRSNLAWYQSWGIRAAAIVLAIILCSLIGTAVSDSSPFDILGTIFKGAFGSERKIWITFQKMSVLLIISLALTPAFKMKFWNIGGEGQVLIGALASAACMFLLGGKLPNAVVVLLMVISSMAAGAIWGVIPALFKAKWNTNETLSTLMMNYIATQLVAFFIVIWVPNGSNTMGVINQNTEAGWLPLIGNKYLLTILIAAIVTAGMFVYLNYSKQGYEIAVVGESERTARYVGIKVEKVIIRTMILSGALCGVAGLVLVGGIDHTISTTIVGGQGFTAVMVSWLAQFNPITMIFTSLLIVFMGNGSSQLASDIGLNKSFSDILTGIIILFIIGSEFFIRYKIVVRTKTGKGAVK